MNRTGKSLLLLAAFGIGFGAHAATPDSRYGTIVDRNIFRLTSPPEPVVPTNPDPALERNIELSGISNIGGKKKAWFIVKTKGAKEPLYVSLSEGESQESIEVSNISEEKGEVKVVNSGNPMILSFKNNAPKATASGVPPAPATPGAVPRPVVSNNTPTSPANAASRYGGGSSVLVSGGAASPSPIQASQATATAASGLRTIPTRALRLPSGVQQQSQQQSRQHQAPINPQKQREMMEIQKMVYDTAGVPLPPLPPSTTVNSGGGPPAPPTPGGYQNR